MGAKPYDDRPRLRKIIWLTGNFLKNKEKKTKKENKKINFVLFCGPQNRETQTH